MSTAELSTPRGDLPASTDGTVPAAHARPRNGVLTWLRLLRSELRLMFRRWRNLALLGVLVVLPVILGIGLRVSMPHGGGGGGNGPGASFFAQLAGNGVFLSFLALTILLTLVLPLVVAVVAGDSIAGEAGLGTLRYLLTVPAGRTRLLSVKYVGVVIFGLAACLLVSAVSLIMGAILFPIGPVTLLSGTTVSLADGLLRLLFVTLYVAISTLTEHPIGAIAAVLVLAVASEVADNVAQFAVIHPYLPTHFWLSFDSLLRAPVDTTTLLHGLLSFAAYIVIFGSIAWARFTSADVTS
jgi:ABC-type transport system involved in multi-copper enzyme maturation permease subunit